MNVQTDYDRGAAFGRLRTYELVDVVDSRSNELIWRGWARWIASENPSPEQLGEDLNKAVLRILDEFPPGRAGIPSPVASA
jgi:hypothetical protein